MPCCAIQRESSRKRHETEAQSEKKNAVSEWLELLVSQDDAAWKEHLIGMGSAPHVPKLFHHNGKVCLSVWRWLGGGGLLHLKGKVQKSNLKALGLYGH